MIEFTLGGAWFRWSALDRPSKWLAGLSCLGAFLAPVPIGRIFGAVFAGDPLLLNQVEFGFFKSLAVFWALGFGALSAVLWWRFSLRQDEMFNRIQNWTIGTASALTMALLVIWAILESTGAAPPVSIKATLVIYLAALTGFWFVAVRRWA